jgi:type III secretory pathway component EscR
MGYHESIIPIVASVLGSVALILSIYVFKRTLDFQAYRELDSNYMEVMKISIEHPYLRDPDKTRDYKIKFTDDKERLTYETYAHLVWNICETAYDRKKIDKTWLPAIKDEKKLHLT